MALEDPILVAGEEGAMVRLVDPDEAGHLPIAVRERGQLALGEPIKVVKSAPLRSPQKASILQRVEVVVEIEPGARRFAKYRAARARGGIDGQQVEMLLVAAFALDVERLAILRPFHPGEINVGIGAEIDLGAAASVRVHHP